MILRRSFTIKLFAAPFMSAKQNKFLKLVQGWMTVVEYKKKYTSSFPSMRVMTKHFERTRVSHMR